MDPLGMLHDATCTAFTIIYLFLKADLLGILMKSGSGVLSGDAGGESQESWKSSKRSVCESQRHHIWHCFLIRFIINFPIHY